MFRAPMIPRSAWCGRLTTSASFSGGSNGDAAVVVIGSGFIGCEIASSLRIRGHPVSLVSDEPQPNAARLGRSRPAH